MKTCFVIMPIGTENSETRKHSDKVYKHIIKKAFEESKLEYSCMRSDEVSKPNHIIKDVVKNLNEANIVIADLTNQNPNVFYELGARHTMAGKTILISSKLDFLPFDLQGYRTIIYDITDPDNIEISKKRLIEYLISLEKNPDSNDNPILETLGKIKFPDTSINSLEEIINLRNSMDSFKFSFLDFVKNDLTRELGNSLSSIIKENYKEPSQTISHIVTINKCGINNIYPTRIEAYNRIVELLETATQQIKIMGISLRKFFHNDTDIDEKIKSFKTKQSFDWQILILDPESEQAIFRSVREQEGMYKEALRQTEGVNYSLIGINDLLDKIKPIYGKSKLFKDLERTKDDIEFTLKKQGFNIDLKYYQAAPVCFMALIDDRIFIEQYHYGATSDTRVAEQVPVFEFSRGSSMYYQMDGHFKYVWEHLSRPAYK